jgi:hypothetical protein
MLACLTCAGLVGYAFLSVGNLFREQWLMAPRSPAEFNLMDYRAAPEGFAYCVFSTSPPAVALDQGDSTHRPVGFGRIDKGEGRWYILVPDARADRTEELGVWLRNEGGYWITQTPMRRPETAMGSDEWQRLWSRCEVVEPPGPSFADALK